MLRKSQLAKHADDMVPNPKTTLQNNAQLMPRSVHTASSSPHQQEPYRRSTQVV